MTGGQRGGLAIAFVTAVGVALAMPVVDADDKRTTRAEEPSEPEQPSPTEEPEPTEEPSEEPSPTPPEAEPVGPPDELAARVPDGCLTAQPLPFPGGVVTVAANGDVTWSSVEGGTATTFPVDRPGVPAAFSPSGNLIAVNDGSIWTADGEPVATERISPVWAWSPQADCLFALSPERGLVVTSAGGESVSLLVGPLTSFAVAPSGDRIVVFADDSATLYDLRSGALLGDQVSVPNPSAPLLWSGRDLLYGSRSGAGMEVHALRAGGDGLTDEGSFPEPIAPGSLSACGGDPLAVDLDGRLIRVSDGSALGEEGFRHARPSCSPEGSFVAVSRWAEGETPLDATLVALTADGSASPIGSGDGAEHLPEWGPPDTGVVFLSTPRGGGASNVIYARTTGGTTLQIRAGRLPGFDWSATPPTGVPATRI